MNHIKDIGNSISGNFVIYNPFSPRLCLIYGRYIMPILTKSFDKHGLWAVRVWFTMSSSVTVAVKRDIFFQESYSKRNHKESFHQEKIIKCFFFTTLLYACISSISVSCNFALNGHIFLPLTKCLQIAYKH